MENAVDALKIAFAMFILILAISITFSLITKARATGEYVLFYADKTNFYDNNESYEENRNVSVSEVISTLYKYIDNSIYARVLIDGDEYIFDVNKETIFDEDGRVINIGKIADKNSKIKNLDIFISKKLLKIDDNASFSEEFDEISRGRNL